MQKKNWIIWFICGAFLIIFLCFGIYKITQNIKKDKEEAQKQESSVQTNYAYFNEIAISFNEQKKKIDSLMQGVYYTTLPEQNEYIVAALDEFHKIIEKMDEVAKNLQDLCQVTYVNQQINNYCTSFLISYDTAVSLYQDTIADYNTLIEQYNEWRKSNSKYEELFPYVVGENER